MCSFLTNTIFRSPLSILSGGTIPRDGEIFSESTGCRDVVFGGFFYYVARVGSSYHGMLGIGLQEVDVVCRSASITFCLARIFGQCAIKALPCHNDACEIYLSLDLDLVSSAGFGDLQWTVHD